jgi:hypothetical protein
MTFRASIPWWFRIGAKLVLARVPVPYALWRRASLFRHGKMDRIEYARGVFANHWECVRPAFGAAPRPLACLELGPGDSLYSAMVARAHGFERIHLVDAGRFARWDPGSYRRAADQLRADGLPAPELADVSTATEYLARCGGVYLTNGLVSLRAVPSGSVHFAWSHAVLEHVRSEEVLPTLRELRRVMAPAGACSHRVDLQDHLGGGLHHLRFSRAVWESPAFGRRSGFYTNRLRFGAFLELFGEAGFRVEVREVDRWNSLPIVRERLDPEFRALPEAELRVSGFHVLLFPA